MDVRSSHKSKGLHRPVGSLDPPTSLFVNKTYTLYTCVRVKVSALLQRKLAKRTSRQLLSNKGIYIEDTDASYALLVQQVDS